LSSRYVSGPSRDWVKTNAQFGNASARSATHCLRVQDVVAEMLQLAERVVKVSDAPRGPNLLIWSAFMNIQWLAAVRDGRFRAVTSVVSVQTEVRFWNLRASGYILTPDADPF
jgi:hypothetical protein